MDVRKIRKEFPIFQKRINGKRLIYFDNACSILKPNFVIRTLSYYCQNLGACSGSRSSHHLSWKTQELIEQAREKVKKFINASSTKEIIWTRNATEGINLIASCFPFKKDKSEVVLTLLEHHSCLLPFYEQSRRRNFKIKIVPIHKDGTLDLNLLDNAITKKTALVVSSHLSNVTGLIYPIREIVSLAHSKGAKILVDDAQFVANHIEDVRRNQIDFLVFSGHKIGAPTGIGVLYIKEPLIKDLLPYNVGGGTVQSVRVKNGKIKVKYLPPPFRFEAGVQDYSGIIGLNSAIGFLENQRQNKITNWVEKLSLYALEQLKKVSEVKFLANYNIQKPSSLISFYFNQKELSLYDFNLFLNHELKDYFIAVRCGHHCAQPLHQFLGSPISMRLSFFIYNSVKEIDIFINALQEFLSK